jgi:hypothetical protein
VKRLVDLRDLELGQYKELTHMLRRDGIFLHETTTSFMAYGAILVTDADFPRAVEILRSESASYAARARAKWDDNGGSSTSRLMFAGWLVSSSTALSA